jgi:hypothetical protein
MKKSSSGLLISLVGLVLLARPMEMSFAAPRPTPQVDVILWFDTEDYLLPASDDAAKRVAEMLTDRNIRATFKLVGEKARTLERRGRKDVIAALRNHSIGYHSDFHSVHPTPSEYLADCGLLDGIAEFVRREGDGAADVRRIFGVETLSCYGQPGSSWGSQTIAGLKEIGVAPSGVPCYVDEGTHVGLNEKPFWYANGLVVYHMGQNWTRMDLHDPQAVEPAKKKVSEIADKLRGEGGGLISIFYHPCEWVHREFWDGVNFLRGQNPPREEWKPPRQRSAEETEGAFRRFAEYVDHIRSIPGVRFVTADDLPSIYPDSIRSAGAPEIDVRELARRLAGTGKKALNFQVIENRAYSMADQFALFTEAVSEVFEKRAPRFPLKSPALLGPDNPPPPSAPAVPVPVSAFREAVLDARDFIRQQHRIPARVFVGPDAFAPADFLIGLAAACDAYLNKGAFPGTISVGGDVELLAARQIAQDTPNLFGGWVIHRAGFRAPKILEVARQQTWSLKPAIRQD